MRLLLLVCFIMVMWCEAPLLFAFSGMGLSTHVYDDIIGSIRTCASVLMVDSIPQNERQSCALLRSRCQCGLATTHAHDG